MKVLARDATIGAMAVVTRMDAGAVIPAQFHSQADEPAYVLKGEPIEDGEPHGPHATTGCTLLTHFSAELNFPLI